MIIIFNKAQHTLESMSQEAIQPHSFDVPIDSHFEGSDMHLCSVAHTVLVPED